jgi:HPt (histidine-containing phosphotransfer) domain-containing protein
MADTPVLDRQVIETLRQLTPPGEPDVLTEVLQMFLSEVPPRLERLRNAWAAGDIQGVYRAAHSLKGSAGNIGAQRLYDVAAQLDELGRAGDAAGIAPLMDALRTEFDKVEDEIRRLLAAGGPH